MPRRAQPDAHGTRGRRCQRSRRRRSRVIIAGGGVLYSEAAGHAEGFRRAARHSGHARRKAGKSSLPHDQPLNMGSVGVTGIVGLQPARRAGRRGAGRRLAAAGFHHRLLGAVQGRRREDRRPERPALRRRQAPRPAAGRRRPGGPRGAGREASAAGSRLLPGSPTAKAAKADWLQGRRQGRHRPRPTPHCRRMRRSSARCSARAARRSIAGLRLGRPAGRTAQALAGRRAGQLPSGIRLFDAWATRSPAASASRWRGPTTTWSSCSATAAT